MKLLLDSSFLQRFPRLRVAVVEATLGADPDLAGVATHWAQAWAAFRARGLASALDHAHVAAYRAALKAAGIRVNEYPPAIEALTRRALKQETPFSVHPVVDFYNGVCLTHVTPAGAFDLDSLTASDLNLRPSRVGDRFTPAGSDEAIDLAAGELAWFNGSTALSRHFIWRQARQSLIGPHTRRLVLISEFVDGIDDAVADAVTHALEQGARSLLGAHTRVHRLDAARPTAELGIDAARIQLVDSPQDTESSR